MGASFVPGDMVLSDDTTALIYKDTTFNTQRFNLVLEDSWINQDPASDTEFSFFIDETRRYHPYTIFMISDLHRVSSIRADTAAGDDNRFIRMSDVGYNLALPLIPKKATYD